MGMTQPGIKPTIYQSQCRYSTTRPLSQCCEVFTRKYSLNNVWLGNIKGPNLTEHSVEMEAQTEQQCILLYAILACPIMNIYFC